MRAHKWRSYSLLFTVCTHRRRRKCSGGGPGEGDDDLGGPGRTELLVCRSICVQANRARKPAVSPRRLIRSRTPWVWRCCERPLWLLLLLLVYMCAGLSAPAATAADT